MKKLPELLFRSEDQNIQNEETSLLQPGLLQRKSTRIKIAGISCCILTSGSVATIVYYATRKGNNDVPDIPVNPVNGKPKLTFNFQATQAGRGQITINNIGDGDAEILDIQFATNALITTPPQGNLTPTGSQIETTSTEGNWVTYKVTEPSQTKVIIEAATSKEFVYSFNQARGPLNVGILPKDIVLTATDGTYQAPLSQKCDGNACNDPFPGNLVGGYYAERDMYQRQFNVNQINPKALNHIYYGPVTCDTTGNVIMTDINADSIQLPQLMQLQQQYPYLKIALSFGGKNCSDALPYLAKDATARVRFTNNTLAALNQFNFSGVNINWEYPRQEDGYNYVFLLQSLREGINNSGKQYELSFTGPGTADKINLLGFRLHDLEKFVDYTTLKAYRYNGPTSSRSDYQSPMALPPNDPNGQANSVTATIGLYQHYLFPNNKVVLGIDTVYVGVQVNNMATDGIWQPIIGASPGQFNETGLYDYACVMTRDCHGGNALPANCQYLNEQQAFFGNFSKTPVIICNDTQLVFTGESPSSVQTKTAYALQSTMKGIYFSSLSADIQKPESQSLLHAADEVINPTNTTLFPREARDIPEITSVDEWNEFREGFEANMASSFLGGVAYTLVFKLINEMTDKIFDKITLKDENSFIENASLHYSLKTTIYFTTLYFIGAPMLPTIAGKFIGDFLHSMLKLNDKEALMTGSFTSLCLNVGTKPELQSPAGIALATVSLLASMAGGYTSQLMIDQLSALRQYTHSIYQASKQCYDYVSNFGFFARSKKPLLEEPKVEELSENSVLTV